MGAIEKLLAIATNEIGYLEKASAKSLYDKTANAGSANYTKYGYEMHKLYPVTMDYPAAWCDCFVDWCFVQAFGAEKAKQMLYRLDDYTVNSAGFFKNRGQWHKSPRAGDQVFFTNSNGGICHTGLVCSVDDKYVYTIEGNTSSASGVIANGGGVRKKSYKLNYKYIAGYGRPDYSLVEEPLVFTEQAVDLVGTITALSLNIRTEPTTNSTIKGIQAKGDVVNIVAKTDNGWYRVEYPDIGTGYLSAEYVSVAEKIPPMTNENVTAEKDNTPDVWAAEAVNNAVKNGILFGDAVGNYKLHSNCTRQEMLVFLYRLYKITQ